MLRTDPESFSDVMNSFEEYSLSFIFKGNKQKIQCLSSIQSLRIGQKSNVMRGFYVDLTDPLRLSSSSVLRVDPNVTLCLTSDLGSSLTIQSVKSLDLKHLGSYGQQEVQDNGRNDPNRLNGSAVI